MKETSLLFIFAMADAVSNLGAIKRYLVENLKTEKTSTRFSARCLRA
jgi:hypothetical protein